MLFKVVSPPDTGPRNFTAQRNTLIGLTAEMHGVVSYVTQQEVI